MRFVEIPVTKLDAWCRSCGRDFTIDLLTRGCLPEAILGLARAECACGAGILHIDLGIYRRSLSHDRRVRRRLPDGDHLAIWSDWSMTGIYSSAGDAVAHRLLDLCPYPSGFEDGPRDLDEVRSVLLLLDRLPEAERRFREMADVSPCWAAYVAHHDELRVKLIAEAGSDLGPAPTPESERFFEDVRQSMREAQEASDEAYVVEVAIWNRMRCERRDVSSTTTFAEIGLDEEDLVHVLERLGLTDDVSAEEMVGMRSVRDVVDLVHARQTSSGARYGRAPDGGWWTPKEDENLLVS